MIEADTRGPTIIQDETVDGESFDASEHSHRLTVETGHPQRNMRWSPTGLFRFSALTFNGHKIHYNQDWTREVEGHPGEVVHGPLNLINMLDYWRDQYGGQDGMPREISYRAMSPIYAGESYAVRTDSSREADDGRLHEIVVDKKGVICMKGQILGGK